MKDSRTGESRSVSNRIKEATSLAAEQVKDVSAKVADKTSSALAESSSAVSRKVADAASSVAGSAYAASGKAADITLAAMGDVQSRFRKALCATVPIADTLLMTTQGLLASSLSHDLNGWLQEIGTHQNEAAVRHGDETAWRIQSLRETGRSSRASLWT